MHPGNEANQDDRQILRRPILRAICEGGEQNHLHFSGSSSVAGCPTLRKKREGWGTRSFVAGQEILASISDAVP